MRNEEREEGVRKTVVKVANIMMIAAAVLVLGALFGCSGVPMPKHDGMVARASVGVGLTHVRGEVDNLISGETESESAEGEMYGIRLELAEHPKYMNNTSVGLRLQAMVRKVDESGLGAGGTGLLELDTEGVEIHGVLRQYFPISNTVRPFAEIFGGAAYNSGDLTASGGGLSSSIISSDKDWSGVGGLGLGMEFDLSSSASLFFQGDYSIRMGEASPLNLQVQDFTLWVGGELRF